MRLSSTLCRWVSSPLDGCPAYRQLLKGTTASRYDAKNCSAWAMISMSFWDCLIIEDERNMAAPLPARNETAITALVSRWRTFSNEAQVLSFCEENENNFVGKGDFDRLFGTMMNYQQCILLWSTYRSSQSSKESTTWETHCVPYSTAWQQTLPYCGAYLLRCRNWDGH